MGLIFLISYFKCELFGVNYSVYGLRRDVLFHVLVKDRRYNRTRLLNLEEFAKGVHGWMGAGGILSNSSDHSLIKGAPHEALKSSILILTSLSSVNMWSNSTKPMDSCSIMPHVKGKM